MLLSGEIISRVCACAHKQFRATEDFRVENVGNLGLLKMGTLIVKD